MTIKIKVKKLNENAKLPCYAHNGDAGMDVFSSVDETIFPGERKTISTGIAIEIPKDCVALIWDKSGLASNHGIKTMAGVCDANYRGEYKIVLLNTGKEKFEIKKGDKIAQILLQKIENAEIEEVYLLNETERNEHGFGSSGR